MTNLLPQILRDRDLNASDNDDVKVLDDLIMKQVRFYLYIILNYYWFDLHVNNVTHLHAYTTGWR